MTTVFGMGAVLGALGALLGSVRLWQRWGSPDPELARKTVHVGMGLVALSLPWLFHDVWPVVFLAVLASGALALLRFSPLRKQMGGVLGGVGRDSLGEFYFPLSLAILFAISHGDAVRFCIPVLVLAVADAAAALVGSRYGRLKYDTGEGRKTWEGSATFFMMTFLAVHLPLLLLTDTGRFQSVLIAVLLGAVLMMVEGVAWKGLDNLFVPLASFALLDVCLELSAFAILVRIVAVVALFALIIVWRRLTTLDHGARLAAVLVGFVCFSVGGWWWLVPPLALFLFYTQLHHVPKTENQHSTDSVLAVSAVGFGWLIAGRAAGSDDFFWGFAASYAAEMGCLGVALQALRVGEGSVAGVVVKSGLWAALLVAVPSFAVMWPWMNSAVPGAAVAMAALVATPAFAVWQPSIRDCPLDAPRWIRQTAVCAAVSTGAFAVLVANELVWR